MRDRQRGTAFNIVFTLFTKFVLLFGGFVISIILARLLGPEGKGLVTAVMVFPLLIVNFADMGIRQSTAYYIGKNQYEISDVISSIGFLWLCTASASIIIVLLYYLFGLSENYSWLLLILGLAMVPIQLVSKYASGIMLGRNQISTINISHLIRLLANFISVLLLVWVLDLGALGAIVVQIFNSVIIAIYYVLKVNEIDKIKFKPIHPIPKLLFVKGFPFAAVLFIISLNYKIDIIILEYMVLPEEIGIYSVGVNFAELLWQIPAAVGMVIFSKSATSNNRLDSVERSTAILRLVLPIMVVASLFLGLMAPNVIGALYGDAFTEAGVVLRILLPGICLLAVSKILHPDLAGRGYPLHALKVFLGSLFVNILLNMLLIPNYGIQGAAFSSTISYLISGTTFGYIYAKKENIPLSNIFILNKSDISRIGSVTGNLNYKIRQYIN